MAKNNLEGSFSKAGINWARRLVDEYAFALDDIPEMIRVRLYQGVGRDWFETEQSHYLQTAGMSAPAVADTQRYPTLQEALEDVLKDFTEGYQAAIRAGHTPDISWLLPNRDFQ